MDTKKKQVLGFAFYDGPERMNRVLLLRKKKPEEHKGLLNGFGGKVEDNETAEQAMVREFKEEAGITTISRQWKLFAVIQHASHHVLCYRIDLPLDRLDKANYDNPDIQYVATNVLPHDVVPDLKYLIPLALAVGIAPVVIADAQP